MRTALSIAGSDSSGGAGIQADLKTMTMNGVFAMSAVTALTAQNTTGVIGILEADPEFLQKQIDAVYNICERFNIERSSAYNKKNRALQHLALLLYGK